MLIRIAIPGGLDGEKTEGNYPLEWVETILRLVAGKMRPQAAIGCGKWQRFRYADAFIISRTKFPVWFDFLFLIASCW
jgi:hypothetical protein